MDNSNLRIVFRFDNEDLDANRNGYMTKRQRVRLRDKRWGKLAPYAGFTALLVFIFMCSLVGSGFSPRPIVNTLSILGLILSIIAPLIGAMALLAYRDLRRIKTDLYKGDVSTLMGRTRLDIVSGGRGSVSYKLDIGGLHLISRRINSL